MSQSKEKVNPITLRSKNWIVNSLIELMDKKPYSKITLKEISQNADLTRQTLYRNFPTKEAILEYYVDGFYSNFIKIISAKDHIALYDLLITYFEYWYKNREFVKKLIDNNVYSTLLDLHLKYISSMATDKKFEKLTFISNNDYFNHFSAGGLWFALKKWIQDGTEKTPEEMTNIILNFYYIKGVNTENIKNEI
ncbi:MULTISPECIES: TetR/AcrR family transcriptional regulator [Clostridium]|uniref:Bacterial regulatory s, tetR family protein n=1 Tax=Clostridium sporogenes TaxID=1509 RepID=A0A0E1QFI1_CLOSG|nr:MULTISPECIES: TetR/AcrR family transcriptional regulator [Clostridium]APH14872.1 bacterial regulatory s, tetR family protein [Clostridium sporogenes]APQ96198.1 bacterial regulatory s, tetR family protein [Clostridium botulinum]KEI75255.1 AcrR family transcriptional regulator [Clostridium botulinum B2 128]KEI88975.1 AcrR family transcriptional regulator [Clostridium botulinum B2 433]MBN3360802.1 TetR/AcrR family transcriptional regulator [Clostridium botulinum]